MKGYLTYISRLAEQELTERERLFLELARELAWEIEGMESEVRKLGDRVTGISDSNARLWKTVQSGKGEE